MRFTILIIGCILLCLSPNLEKAVAADPPESTAPAQSVKSQPQINWADLSASSGMCVIDQKMCGGNYKTFLLIGRRTRDVGQEVSTNSVYAAVTNVINELKQSEVNIKALNELAINAATNKTSILMLERSQILMQEGINRCIESGQILEHSLQAIPVRDLRFKTLQPLVETAQSNLMVRINFAREATKKYLSVPEGAIK